MLLPPPPMNNQVPPAGVPAGIPPVKPPTPGLAIASLILGIIAIVLSFIPIINNISFPLAIVGLILGIVALVQHSKKHTGGKGLAIAGVILAVLALIITIVVQVLATMALDEVAKDIDKATQTVTSPDTSSSADSNAKKDSTEPLAVGKSVTLDNGLEISVDSVNANYVDTVDDHYVMINVTYKNNGDKKISYNNLDWKGTNAQGAESDMAIAFPDDSVKQLESGNLNPGGTISGTVFLNADAVSASYYSDIIDDEATASWKLS